MILSMEAVANAIADPNRSPDNPHFLWRHKNHKKKYVSQAASRARKLPQLLPPLPLLLPLGFPGPKTSNDRSHAASCGNPHFHALVAFSFSFSCAPLLSRPKIQDTDRQFILWLIANKNRKYETLAHTLAYEDGVFTFCFFFLFPDGIHIVGQNPCGWVRVWVLVVRWWWFHAQIGHMSLTWLLL